MDKIRLDRLLANQLQMTRSDAKTAVRRGRVTVNGVVVREIGQAVSPGSDTVKLDGTEVKYQQYRYILLNKPAGILSVSTDAKRETVLDLVPEGLRRNGMFPVGRLDKDTTGLLLITDDGEFAHRVISPKSGVPKRYLATLDGTVTDEMVAVFRQGVTLADGTVCKPAELKPIDTNRAYLTLTEGKYHEVKRMFGTVGLGVNQLHRESIGELILPDDILPGKCVEMSFDSLKSALFDKSYTF